jgi:predicted nucleic acid-binding protein
VIVVADTSVILNLTRVGHAHLLQSLYREVWIPTEVSREFSRQVSGNPRFRALEAPPWLQVRDPAGIPEPICSDERLDAGEQAALALALEIHADAILIDEENGRSVASELGLNRVGIFGILLRAKTVGLIPAVKPVFDALQHDAGFWISKSSRERVLRLAGENE